MTDWKAASAFPQDNLVTKDWVASFDAATCATNGGDPSKRVFLRRRSQEHPTVVVTTQTRPGTDGGVALSSHLYGKLVPENPNGTGALIEYRTARWLAVVFRDRATGRDAVVAVLAFLVAVAAAVLALWRALGQRATVPLWVIVVAAALATALAIAKLNADLHKAGD